MYIRNVNKMVEEDSNTEKSTKIYLTGDKEKCSHCADDDKKLVDHTNIGYEYKYTDVNSDEGQNQLKNWGVKEGESVDIPVIKVESCEWNKSSPSDKKCKTVDWKHDYWEDLDQGNLPDIS